MFPHFLLAYFSLENLLLRIIVVIFYPTHYAFQDMQIEMRIGLGREHGGLYNLDDGTLHSGLVAIFSELRYSGIINWGTLRCKSCVK